jgi:hypothetical protein
MLLNIQDSKRICLRKSKKSQNHQNTQATQTKRMTFEKVKVIKTKKSATEADSWGAQSQLFN